MVDDRIDEVLALVGEECRSWPAPSVSVIAGQYRTPFHVLISCIISLRTKDAVTAAASKRLFSRANGPHEIVRLSPDEIASLIYPAGFYRVKAQQIHQLCVRLIDEYNGQVPDSIDALLAFTGVGRKTANLVITMGYGKPGICVDAHVHRIVNRWGYVCSKNPEQTEQVLRAKLPLRYWLKINDLLVCYGQHRCLPVSPRCSTCCLSVYCDRVGVVTSR